MLTNIFLGTIALYVAVEFGTAIYILLNKRTAIPRIRASLRYILGLNQDAANVQIATGEVLSLVNSIENRRVEAIAVEESRRKAQEEITAAFFSKQKVTKNNKVVKLAARRK